MAESPTDPLPGQPGNIDIDVLLDDIRKTSEEVVRLNAALAEEQERAEELADERDLLRERNTALRAKVKKGNATRVEDSAKPSGRSPLSSARAVARRARSRKAAPGPAQSVTGIPIVSEEDAAKKIDSRLLAAIRCIFDESYYTGAYPDVEASDFTPFDHYLNIGRGEFRQPSLMFDPSRYLADNKDVSLHGIEPLEHYLLAGGFEGRNPIPEFDSEWYLDANRDVKEAELNPLVHFVTSGSAELRNPSPMFNAKFYLDKYPDAKEYTKNPLIHYLLIGSEEGRMTGGRGVVSMDLLYRRWPGIEPLRVIGEAGPPRVNIVTDSLQPTSLFGGVATAILVAALWAERTDRTLRVVTRTEVSDLGDLSSLLSLNGITLDHNPEIVHIPLEKGDFLEVGDADVFLTTSWWTTASALASIPAERIAYILQEDEREFYPSGDERLLAAETMNTPGITVIVNTANLLEQLIDSGLDGLRETATAFEPAFSLYMSDGQARPRSANRNLFFYGRPNNPRNLFYRGTRALDLAIERGILDTSAWTVCVAGHSVPRFSFCDGSNPRYFEGMSWETYRTFLNTIDLGFSLMATPHPSYPPLDLAAAGAVVVTNTWPGKPDLSRFAPRMIQAEPSLEGLVQGLQRGLAAADAPAAGAGILPPYSNDWQTNLSETIERLAREFANV